MLMTSTSIKVDNRLAENVAMFNNLLIKIMAKVVYKNIYEKLGKHIFMYVCIYLDT